MKQFRLPETLEQWDHVSVSWEDIIEHTGGRHSAQFTGPIRPCIRRTAGYVIQYTDKYLVIAATDDRESQQEEDCECITIIPIGNIRRIARK